MCEILTFIPELSQVGVRLDSFLSDEVEELSRSAAQKLIESSAVLVNSKPVSKSYKLRGDEIITLTLPSPVELEILPQDIPIDVIYEDSDLLVVNKPKGMVVHPAPGHYDKTLVNALLFHCRDSLSGINGVIRPGIVHRIDMDTSGLLMIAKNDKSHGGLATQLKEHSFLREYEAVVHGRCKEDSFTIDLPIGRNKKDRKKMCVTSENSKNAITHCEVLGRYDGFTHIKCRLETGRTHQIRVHLSHIGHPLAGDTVYGNGKLSSRFEELQGQCLHARTLGFCHPSSGEWMEFTSELPDYFIKFISTLKRGE